MPYDPRQYHRRSIRLKGYDYSQEGAYFITICTAKHKCILGKITDGSMRQNEFGEIAQHEWLRTAVARYNVFIDTFIIMPNHLHGIIVITGAEVRRGDPAGRPYTPNHPPNSRGPTSGSIGAIIGQFKSRAAKRINSARGTPGARVWQRNYYEHVIRDEEELNLVRQYVMGNPLQWDTDENNPDRHDLTAAYGMRHPDQKP